MEGRGRQDGDMVRRSGAFSGRQMPLEMGKVRVGGSGRPVPTLFSTMTSRHAVISSQEAAALSPRVRLEPHPRSPFRRKEEFSKAVVRVSQKSSSSRFQVKKVTGPRPLSARSPQIRDRRSRSTMGEFTSQSTEFVAQSTEKWEESEEEVVVVVSDKMERTGYIGNKPLVRKRALQERRINDLVSKDDEDAAHVAVDLIPDLPHGSKKQTVFKEEEKFYSNFEDMDATGVRNRQTLVLPTTGAGAGTFVSSMPSLTKLRSAFTARELVLFTQRLDPVESDDKVQTRYHVASHPHSTAAATSTASIDTRQEELGGGGSAGNTHKRSLPLSTRRIAATVFNEAKTENGHSESSWKRVDSSIDHIYEDPSIDLVQLHLLHSHHTATGQKKRKMMERERVLAAASGLRETKSEELRRQEQAHERKLQIQKMSEAIRLQNRRAVRARSVRSAGAVDRRTYGRRTEITPNLPERKPAVPRLSGNGKQVQTKRRRKSIKGASGSHGGVSASILMGSVSNGNPGDEVQQSEDDGNDAMITKAEAVDHEAVKRKPPATTRQSKKKKKQEVPVLVGDVEAAAKAREERRAIAREYMQMQKQSRRIWSAKAKEQCQLEQDKRQQQLEILEATRLKNLRLSKKKAKNRKKQEETDPVSLESVSPEEEATIMRNSSIVKDEGVPAVISFATSSKVNRNDMESFLDDPHLNSENDQAIGNVRLTERLFDVERETESVNTTRFGELSPTHETEQNDEADQRVRKLLQLREKASALTARLNGLRKRTTGTTQVRVSSTDVCEHDDAVDPSATGTVSFARNERQDLPRDSVKAALPSFEKVQLASECTSGRDDKSSVGCESDHGSKKESAEADEKDSDLSSVYGADPVTDSMDSLQHSSKEDTEGDENARSSFTRTRQVFVHKEEFSRVSSGVEVYGGDEDEEEIDVRSIGVYNIGVVWPLQHDSKEAVITAESTKIARSASACSSSSFSSVVSSSSSAIKEKPHLSAAMNDDSDEEEKCNEEASEVAFYHLKNRLHASGYVTTADDEINARRQEESRADTSDSDDDPDYERLLPKSKPSSMGTFVLPVRVRNYGESSQPNVGLMKLIQETDDSLSVIDRAAKKLYYEQRERLEREKEENLQRRIQAEKEELIRKDRALKAVMDSLSGADSNGGEAGGSENDGGLYSDDEKVMESAQYKRLEEIMEDVEKERTREKEMSSCSLDDEPYLDETYDRNAPERLHRDPKLSVRHHEEVATSSSSPAFWDQLVAESTGDGFTIHPDSGDFDRTRVQIDKSDLIAQRESQLREEDEQISDSPPRVHSPRTLSKRLMAAVEYQEALHEAHMQLSMMEHAHELETVQAETITLAHAFKEEMENSATTHQIALDHATLEKKFDGDMQEVLQQLDIIRQGEEQEQIADNARMEIELRIANLRECSVQTETAQWADASTSAMLCVDSATSPARLLVDVAVQHESPMPKPEVPFIAVNTIDELEYLSGEEEGEYEEKFETESHVQGSLPSDYTSELISDVRPPTHDQSAIEEENESEIQSVLSGADENDSFEESATSIADQSVDDEELAPSAVESISDDEMNEAYSDEAREKQGSRSESMDYDDDFETSSPKMKEVRNQGFQAATIEEDVADELENSGSIDSSHSDEAVEEQVDEESGGVASIDKVESQQAESDYYSSQFDDTGRGDSKASAVKQTTIESQHWKISRAQISDTVVLRTLENLQRNAVQPADSVAEAYIYDLERRKQAEESLLNLRLQTFEHKFQHEEKQIESAFGREQTDIKAFHELRMRKETLEMAFLAEKANIESLKAAATARYYQDLHTFRSLSLAWPNTMNHVTGSDAFILEPNGTRQLAVDVPSYIHRTPINASAHERLKAADMTLSPHQADEYTDEFASDLESDHVSARGEKTSERSGEIAESGSIASEHSEVFEGASKSSESSEVAEEAFEQNEEVPNKEDEEYEDEFVSMSEDTTVQIQMYTANDDIEVVESSQISDQIKSDSEHSEGEYDEDFTSISEAIPDQLTIQEKDSTNDEVSEVDIEEDNYVDNTKRIEADEITSDEEFVEVNDADLSFYGDVSRVEIIESGQANYADDTFENEALEQSELPYSGQDFAQTSLSLHQGQSNSEDSSTTQLLVAQVAALQKTAGETRELLTQAEDNKLAKKKAKAEELLQAKYNLLNEQKEEFRRDEEKRQVNCFAKMALGMDVEKELRIAKSEIVQQLADDFDDLHQTYPFLKTATTSSFITVRPTGSSRNLLTDDKDTEASPVTTSLAKKLFGKENIVAKSVEVENEYDDEYEAESFEEERQESRADISEEESEVSDYQSANLKLKQDEQSVEDAMEVDGSNDEVAYQPDADVSVVIEEEGSVVSNNVDGEKAESDDYDDDYENYENESFDEAQSASEILINENKSIHKDSEYAANALEGANVLQMIEDDDESGYSDEAFDAVSGSFTDDEQPGSNAPVLPQAKAISIIEVAASMDIAEASATDSEHVRTKEDVAEQLEIKKLADLGEQDAAFAFTTAESKTLITSMSVSLSHDLEEGSLTKSIEERTTRLQILRQKIDERKREILVVQKQMRAERRKEKLAAEERDLWEEMQSVEKLLFADESALTLCRQRNRLEMMQLEARQLENFVAGRSSKETFEPERDLLLGFDYVEKAQASEFSSRSLTGVSLVSTSTCRITRRGIDLLDGYIYIEAIESGIGESLVVPSIAVAQHTDTKADCSESVEDDMSIQTGDSLCLLIKGDGEENVDREFTSAHYSIVHEQIDLGGFASSPADGDDSQEDGKKSFIIAEADENSSVDNEATISQEEECRSKVEIHQENCEQTSELNFPNVDSFSTASPELENFDLLAEYEYVEMAEIHLERKELISTIDLLVDFAFVEDAEAVETPKVNEMKDEEKLPNDDYAGKLEHSMSGSICQEEDIGEQYTNESPSHAEDEFVSRAPSTVDQLASTSTDQSELPTHMECPTVEDEEARGKTLSIARSSEDEGLGNRANASIVDTKSVLDSDDTSPPHEALVSRKEVLAERVTSLLYADLFQTLEKDIADSVSYSRNRKAQILPRDQALLEPEKLIPSLSRMVDTIPCDLDLDSSAGEVGIESIDSRYSADWSMDKSGPGESVTKMDSEAPNDYASEENVSENGSNVSAVRVSSFIDVDSNPVHRVDDGIEFFKELPPNENHSDSLGDTSNNTNNDESKVLQVVIEQVTTAIDTPEVHQNLRDRSENVDRVSDAIFDSAFDEILSSELQLWSSRGSAFQTISRSPKTATSKPIGATVPVETSRESTKHKPNRDSKVRDRKLADLIAEQLEIVDGEIRLPALNAFAIEETSSSTRVLHETIEELAYNCYNAIFQSSSTGLDNASMLAVVRRHIQMEVDELLAIREQSERELERQLQLLSGDTETEGGHTGDLMLSHNCVASNVTSIVYKVQSELSKTSDAFYPSSGPRMLPRTPISRAKKTSILSSLQTQQEQELQQRITGLILSDLMRDAGIS